ncbi:MAG: hypothetical protein WC847_00555 [Candidatus Paceibacterota bacterium]|jgi:hypothetical protein
MKNENLYVGEGPFKGSYEGFKTKISVQPDDIKRVRAEAKSRGQDEDLAEKTYREKIEKANVRISGKEITPEQKVEMDNLANMILAKQAEQQAKQAERNKKESENLQDRKDRLLEILAERNGPRDGQNTQH